MDSSHIHAGAGAPMGAPDPRHEVTFNSQQVAPPSRVYITKDDKLYIAIQNSLTGQGVGVTLRILLPNGQVVYCNYAPTITTDRSVQTTVFDLPEGFLMSLIAGGAPTTVRGQTYVNISLRRGQPLASPSGDEELVAGYIEGNYFLSWPETVTEPKASGMGNIRSITGTAPAAGAEISETVPTNARWRLHLFRAILTSSVAVANRVPQFIIDDGTNNLWQIEAAAVQAASLTIGYNFGAIGSRAPRAVSSNEADPIPPNLILLPGYRLRTSTIAIQAADQYAAPQYQVEEWLFP